MPDSKAYGRGQVLEIINSVITKMDEANHDKREIYMDIAELASSIHALKQEIADSRPDHVKNSHVPGAKDELDAIVAATAEASNKIMNVCEEIQTLSEGMDAGKKDELNNLVVQIFEACSFQDITGQRISKVVTTLREIEDRVERIMDTLSNTVGPLKLSGEMAEKAVSVSDEKSLLNGPQMPEKAITQADIDKLLASFD